MPINPGLYSKTPQVTRDQGTNEYRKRLLKINTNFIMRKNTKIRRPITARVEKNKKFQKLLDKKQTQTKTLLNVLNDLATQTKLKME